MSLSSSAVQSPSAFLPQTQVRKHFSVAPIGQVIFDSSTRTSYTQPPVTTIGDVSFASSFSSVLVVGEVSAAVSPSANPTVAPIGPAPSSPTQPPAPAPVAPPASNPTGPNSPAQAASSNTPSSPSPSGLSRTATSSPTISSTSTRPNTVAAQTTSGAASRRKGLRFKGMVLVGMVAGLILAEMWVA